VPGSDSAPFVHRERDGHRARWLATVDEAYAQMERLIDVATAHVRLESYLVHAEGPATRLRDALLRARQRDVKVDVLYDAFGSEGLPPAFFEPLIAAGARVRRFNPLKLLRLSFRNHRKLMTCDGTFAVVGGFNIAKEYAGDGVSHGWCDIGLELEGPVVAELESSFDAMLALAPFTPAAIRRFRRGAMPATHRPAAGSGSAVRLLVSGPPLPRGRLRRSLRRDLISARDVTVVTGYFLPPRDIRRTLRQCVRRGGSVRLLLAGRSDVPFAKLAAENFYARLLRASIAIFEYQPQILHAKLLVIDDIAWVGSCNLDRRSLHINFELLLRLDWPELAADARQWCEQALARSQEIRRPRFLRERGVWRRWMSRFAWLVLARLDPLLARRRFRSLV
jgi:cardiolipin synthase A/B